MPCAVGGAEMGEGMGGGSHPPIGGPGGLPLGILKFSMKMGAHWCNLENMFYKIKDHLRNKK